MGWVWSGLTKLFLFWPKEKEASLASQRLKGLVLRGKLWWVGSSHLQCWLGRVTKFGFVSISVLCRLRNDGNCVEGGSLNSAHSLTHSLTECFNY